MNAIPQDLLDLFRQESLDRFQELDHALMQLEEGDPEALRTVLRQIHSIKGSAGMFGLQDLKQVAHRLEDLLSTLDRHELVSGTADVLFAGRDLMQRLVQSTVPSEEVQQFLHQLQTRLAESSCTDCSPGRSLNETSRSSATGHLASVRRLLETARVEALSQADTDTFLQQMADLLDTAPADDAALGALVTDAREGLAVFAGMEIDLTAADAFEPVLQALETLDRRASEERLPVEETSHSVRVDDRRVDALVDDVGGLIVLADAYRSFERQLSAEQARSLHRITAELDRHLAQLQEALLSMRRVPAALLLDPLARLARDAAHASGRDVTLETIGRDVELDKSLLDRLRACLGHLVRNAVHHGIESPQERQAADKPAQGRIVVTVAAQAGRMLLNVEDDGRGIDVARLRDKAVARGIHTTESAARLSDDEACALVFAEGLSTATDVTEVSGRGVGMTSVREAVRALGGEITIRNRPGAGACFRIDVPQAVMLSVLDGLLAARGGMSIVLPVQCVEECVALREDDYVTVGGVLRQVRVRGSLLPVLSLETVTPQALPDVHALEALSLAERRRDDRQWQSGPVAGAGTERDNALVAKEAIQQAGIAIVLMSHGRRGALLVDDVLDHHAVVVKPLQGLDGLRSYRGGALLSDGTVGLVVDVAAVLERMHG